jgi:hypothetical protein
VVYRLFHGRASYVVPAAFILWSLAVGYFVLAAISAFAILRGQ